MRKYNMYDKDGVAIKGIIGAIDTSDISVVTQHGGWIESADGKVVHGRKPVGTIKFAPTWKGLLPMFRAVIEDGTDEGKRIAWEELSRMAEAADAYNASQKD